ncbi:MAG: ABC transporter permease subunit [Planctomycetota bacterium]|nr:ABC transporter permease subunit [Planctomycetota bacterium]
MTGKITKSLRNAVLREPDHPGTPPRFIGIGGLGQHVYTAWEDGTLEHWDLSEWSAPKLYEYPEPLDLLTRDDATITTFGFVAGKKTLVIGDDQGGVSTWFPAREEDDDGSPPLLMLSKSWEATGSPVLATVASPRSRLLTVSHADGLVRVFQASLGQLVLETEAGEPLSPVLVAPREDALIGRGRESLWTFEVDFKYPEATLASLFSPVHYEGFREEKHSWQSSSASDDFEPKLGLVPLVFGTLKATFYSLLFGAPLAFLAAIFTSEFLAARMRTGIKSTVELMASLPSVVLGFIAALVIAPFVQGVLATVLACFLTIPATLLGGAFLWQMLPGDRMVRWSGWQRFLAICATLPIGVLLAMVVGPYLIEGLFFSGDLLGWLSGEGTSTTGGWLFLLLPLSALIVAIGSAFFGFKLRDKQTEWTRQKLARFQALKFAAGFGITIVLALVLGLALNGIGVDPRGGLMDTYIQRNAMIVGFAMGFAIVPIIYTLSEDALSEVPADLREGSLGAGATQWQTAVRIVIPYAMSGLFSALMIGLGRAVGETMIVLMAAGNTAIMDWNVFNGFRTLAANIAYEMPEAVVGSAHYRTLFLAALVLFAMTFVLNTAAELARRHFRVRTNAL